MNARPRLGFGTLLALFSLACALPVSAQYPGGSSGSGPALGWSAKAPDGTYGSPGLADDSTFYNFDWTRLYLARNCVYNGISDPDYSGKYFPQSTAGSISVDTSYCTQATISIYGTSTVKWKWTPPHSDLLNFPVPPLFVLGRIRASSYAYNGAGGSTAPEGVTASGQVTDGFGGSPPWSPSFNSIPGQAGVGEIRRQVLSAVDSGPYVQVTMSPTAYLGAFASSNTGGGSGGYGSGYGYGSSGSMSGFTGISEAAMPILLSSPNPLTNPKLGDGSNQYVYDSQTPDGELDIPGSLRVVGAGSDDTNWLVNNNHVDMAIVNSTIPGALTHGWVVGNDLISVNVPGNRPDGSTYPGANWVFIGLPASNSGFGNHLATLYVGGAASQTAHLQTFFTGTAKNHLNPDTTPNWYYYYTQVYTPFNPSSAPANYAASLSASDVSVTESSNPYTVSIKDSAYSASYNTNELRVFALQPGSPGFPEFVGYLTFPGGIAQYIHESAHERGHQYLDQLCGTGRRDGPVYTDVKPSDDPYDVNSSGDGDIVSDTWEFNHHMNSVASDTTHAYAGSGTNDANDGDGEFLADIQALPVVFNQINDWQQDWADGGVQKGQVFFLQPDPNTGVAPGFSLTFTPASTDASGNWTITGSPHPVKSISDIEAITGTAIITSLSDLGP